MHNRKVFSLAKGPFLWHTMSVKPNYSYIMKTQVIISAVLAFLCVCACSKVEITGIATPREIVDAFYDVSDDGILAGCVDDRANKYETLLSHVQATTPSEMNIEEDEIVLSNGIPKAEDWLSYARLTNISFCKSLSEEQDGEITKALLLYKVHLRYDSDVDMPFYLKIERGMAKKLCGDYYLPYPELKLLRIKDAKVTCEDTCVDGTNPWHHYSVDMSITVGYEDMEFDVSNTFKVAVPATPITFSAFVEGWANTDINAGIEL